MNDQKEETLLMLTSYLFGWVQWYLQDGTDNIQIYLCPFFIYFIFGQILSIKSSIISSKLLCNFS